MCLLISEWAGEKTDNVFLRREEKQLAAAATAGKEAGMTHNCCKSCHPIRAQWFKSEAYRVVVMAECLSLHINTWASPTGYITSLKALHNSVEVGRIERLASLAIAADTIDWLAPVSGIQCTRRQRMHAVGGPSHRDISGVGLFAGV